MQAVKCTDLKYIILWILTTICIAIPPNNIWNKTNFPREVCS